MSHVTNRVTPGSGVATLRGGVTDGERVTVYGAGDGGFSRPLNALGLMGDPGESGDLVVTVAVLKEGETRRRG
jgi:hypothetical protein